MAMSGKVPSTGVSVLLELGYLAYKHLQSWVHAKQEKSFEHFRRQEEKEQEEWLVLVRWEGKWPKSHVRKEFQEEEVITRPKHYRKAELEESLGPWHE